MTVPSKRARAPRAPGRAPRPARVLVTQAEYARMKKVSRQAVHKMIAMGRLRTVGKKIDLSTADQQLLANTDLSQSRLFGDDQVEVKAPRSKRARPKNPPPAAPPAGAATPAPPAGTFAAERARREGMQADLAQLEFGERAGQLVRKDGVHAAQFTLARRVRDALLRLPSELAPILAARTNTGAQECHHVLEDYVRKLCEQLADETAAAPPAASTTLL